MAHEGGLADDSSIHYVRNSHPRKVLEILMVASFSGSSFTPTFVSVAEFFHEFIDRYVSQMFVDGILAEPVAVLAQHGLTLCLLLGLP